MNKTISVERLYTLGDYKNIKFTDIITDIPEDIFGKQEAVDVIRFLQMLDIELAYRNYLNLASNLKGLDTEDAIKVIEDTRIATLENLKSILNKDTGE